MPALLLWLSNSILCLSCFSPATILNFQGSSQGQIHRGILANVRLCMLTNQLYLHLYLFGGFFPFLEILALVIFLSSVANKPQCTVELLLSTLEGRFGFRVIDFLLFAILLF